MASAVKRLEREFAARLGVPAAVATGFGRSALALAVEAAVPPGSEVLVPDFICTQVLQAVRRAGCRPTFFPVPRDLIVREADVAAAHTPSARAAVVAHYFGCVQPRIREIADFCRKNEILLIEDCALALGAHCGGRLGGSFGDLAVFSFTKSDWCYGGGVLASRSEKFAGKAFAIRKEKFRRDEKLARAYGMLRRADFVANRPRWCRVAERIGRWLQPILGLETGEDFYDRGQFDALMTELAARRALRILDDLPVTRKLIEAVVQQLHQQRAGYSEILARPVQIGVACPFLLLQSPSGQAARWVEEADRAGVTLRRCWPAYEEPESGEGSVELAWLAEHLLILELHHGLTRGEVARIVETLNHLARLAGMEPSTGQRKRPGGSAG